MKNWRKENGKSTKSISCETGISERLLATVEEGGVTHPDIARKIAKYYGLTEEEAMELMPKPEKRGSNVSYKRITIHKWKIEEIDCYTCQKSNRRRRR